MAKNIKQRFVISPLISMAVFHFLFNRGYGFSGDHEGIILFFKEITILNTYDAIDLAIPMKAFVLMYGYLYGYVFATISLVIKARSFRGILFLLVLFVKIMASAIGVLLAIFPFVIEVLLLPFALHFNKKWKKKKKQKEDDHMRALFREAIQDEVNARQTIKGE